MLALPRVPLVGALLLALASTLSAILPPPLAAQTPRAAAAPAAPPAPRTRPELSGYRETSRYDDVIAFIGSVSHGRRSLHVTQLGYSFEGRALPLVVVGNVGDASPETVRRSGKLRVYIQANIHAGEVEGKEAVLMLLRDLAAGRHARWLDSVVLLIAPIYNADGNERVSLTNRPLQNGPVGGMGQRPNAQGLDLNRDHI
ncbi:MAG: M14 family zinc carboxypeptidase, partial [Gemmatimonadales bacterium]|nr:M14 family zinc carboxypeptidase [Gemmatimonadales bacterium]